MKFTPKQLAAFKAIEKFQAAKAFGYCKYETLIIEIPAYAKRKKLFVILVPDYSIFLWKLEEWTGKNKVKTLVCSKRRGQDPISVSISEGVNKYLFERRIKQAKELSFENLRLA